MGMHARGKKQRGQMKKSGSRTKLLVKGVYTLNKEYGCAGTIEDCYTKDAKWRETHKRHVVEPER